MVGELKARQGSRPSQRYDFSVPITPDTRVTGTAIYGGEEEKFDSRDKANPVTGYIPEVGEKPDACDVKIEAQPGVTLELTGKPCVENFVDGVNKTMPDAVRGHKILPKKPRAPGGPGSGSFTN